MDAEAHELIAGYALDALAPADRARAKELLERSEEAREELRALTETTAAMATAVSGPAPPPGLRDRILESAREDRQTVVPLESRRRRRLVPVLGVAAAVAAVRRRRVRGLGPLRLVGPRRVACSARAGARGCGGACKS